MKRFVVFYADRFFMEADKQTDLVVSQIPDGAFMRHEKTSTTVHWYWVRDGSLIPINDCDVPATLRLYETIMR